MFVCGKCYFFMEMKIYESFLLEVAVKLTLTILLFRQFGGKLTFLMLRFWEQYKKTKVLFKLSKYGLKFEFLTDPYSSLKTESLVTKN